MKYNASKFYMLRVPVLPIDDHILMFESEVLEALSFLNCFKCSIENEDEWSEIAYNLLIKLRKGIYSGAYHPYSIYSGLSHVGFVIRDVTQNIPELHEFGENLNTLLLKNCETFLRVKSEIDTSNNFELIKGISGTTRYLMEYLDDVDVFKMVCRITDYMIERSNDRVILGHSVPGWEYTPNDLEKRYLDYEMPNGCINYGISHGMGGPLTVLALLYDKKVAVSKIKTTIEKILFEYKKAAYYVDDIINWPGRISVEQYLGYKTYPQKHHQVSWCYGSIGILRGMFIGAKALGDNALIDFIVDEMLKIAQLDASKLLLSSPMVCHGYTGVALIMDQMYRDTGNKIFDKSTERVVKIIDNLLDDSVILKQWSYLEGFSGIIQGLNTIYTGKDTYNEKRLLIL